MKHYKPSGELQGDTKAMPDQGTSRGRQGGSTYGADVGPELTKIGATLTQEQKKEQMKSLQESRKAQMKSILTKEQVERLEAKGKNRGGKTKK